MLRLFPTSVHISHFSSPALSLLYTSTYPNFLFSVYLTPSPCLPLMCLSNFCFLFFCPCTQKLRTVFCPCTTPLQKCFAASLMLSFPLASAFFFLFSENSVLPHCNYPFLSAGVSDFTVCRVGKTLILAGVLSARMLLTANDSNYREVLVSHFSFKRQHTTVQYS